MNKNVMVVEDDTLVRKNFMESLSDEGFVVNGYSDQVSALASAKETIPDLALLDISFNDERDAGFQLCANLRRLSKKLPIMFFTSNDNESDKISGIRLGADDYVTKDVSIDYLVIRMEALLRRCAELANPDCSVEKQTVDLKVAGPVAIDLDSLCIYWRGVKVDLSLKQILMTEQLLQRPGQVCNFARFMSAANMCVEPNTITAHIRLIRKAFKSIDPAFDKIESVRGVGYRWLAG